MASAFGVSRGRPPAIRALTLRDETRAPRACRQFRPAIVRYCRARLASAGVRTRTGSLDEDDVAQEVCLALVSALPSYRDMGRPFGAFVFAIAAHKVADAARGAARAPLPVPVLPDLPDRCPGPEVPRARGDRAATSTPGWSGPCWRACPPRSGGCSCSGWWRSCPPRTRGTCSTCHRARSGWPSTGPWPGSAPWPPMTTMRAERASKGHSAPASRGLNKMGTSPLPLPVKVS